ncbi:unnamed protein product [Brassica oleracea]
MMIRWMGCLDCMLRSQKFQFPVSVLVSHGLSLIQTPRRRYRGMKKGCLKGVAQEHSVYTQKKERRGLSSRLTSRLSPRTRTMTGEHILIHTVNITMPSSKSCQKMMLILEYLLDSCIKQKVFQVCFVALTRKLISLTLSVGLQNNSPIVFHHLRRLE